jgi:hypothetical protein
MRHLAIALFAATFLAGCGSDELRGIPGPDAGGPPEGIDAGCEIISHAEIWGLTAPVWRKAPDPSLLEDPDPDRITVLYNGSLVPEKPAHFGRRYYLVPECAGLAEFEVSHTFSKEIIGHAAWDVVEVSTTFKDWVPSLDESKRIMLYPEVYLIAFGEAGAYSVEDMHIRYAPSNVDKELWRFHIVNGLLNDGLTVRLVSGDLDQENGQITPDGDMQTVLVTNLAPKSYTIVENIDHNRWHEYGVIPTKAMLLELYQGDSIEPSNLNTYIPQVIWLPMDVEAIGMPAGTRLPFPSGSVMTLLVYPDWGSVEIQYPFTCRDPLWALNLGESPYPCPED